LDDILNRRVSITVKDVLILADDTQVEPHEHEAYITTVLVLRDTSWVMPERRANQRGDYWLRLTTVGDQMRIRGVGAVTV
jgi:hypothetical protein